MKAKKIAVITAVALVSAGAVSLGTVGIIKNNPIGEAKAKQIALSDSGTAISEARFRRTGFDFENGQFVYEVEFFTDNGEYEYTIGAKDGDIIARDIDIIRPAENNSSPVPPVASDVRIDLETAKNTALADAGVSDVTFTKEKRERNDGIQVYDIEFYTADMEYDYEINALTGEIISRDAEKISENKSNISEKFAYIGIETAKETALADAGVSDATFTKEKRERDDGIQVYDIEFYTADMEYDYEINALTGEIISRDAEKISGNKSNISEKFAYIGIETAKETALSDAGVSDATFTKEKLERDDGMDVYEIEFRTGTTEYEYKINASDGTILECDIDK